jgi:hypothetical protein
VRVGAIEASRVVPHAPARVFEFLADMHNHWQLDPAFAVRDGFVRVRGPLGVRRDARTEVVSLDPPRRLGGYATIGDTTAASVTWDVTADGSGSLVRLAAEVERASPLDRALLALGGRRWLRRRFARVLAALEAQLG